MYWRPPGPSVMAPTNVGTPTARTAPSTIERNGSYRVGSMSTASSGQMARSGGWPASVWWSPAWVRAMTSCSWAALGRGCSSALPWTTATSSERPVGAGIGISAGTIVTPNEVATSAAAAVRLVPARSRARRRSAFTTITTNATPHTPVTEARGSRNPFPACV